MTAVPVIDVSAAADDRAASMQVARSIGAACRDVGFLHVAGHPVAPTLREAAFLGQPEAEMPSIRCDDGVAAPEVPGIRVCYFADRRMRRTSDIHVSTPHGIVGPVGRERFSAACIPGPGPDRLPSSLRNARPSRPNRPDPARRLPSFPPFPDPREIRTCLMPAAMTLPTCRRPR